MGSGVSRRYIGGKRPDIYFHEDLFPSIEATLLKLDLIEERAFKIFEIFVLVDIDISEKVSMLELHKYLGGKRTKLTERILLSSDNTKYDSIALKDGIDYYTFVINLWHFCTLSVGGIARYCFELFDIDNLGLLEKPDLETMYKMFYDCDDCDEKEINLFIFNPHDESILKKDFIDHCKKNKHFIQPALDYQLRLQKKIGGRVLWALLSSFRQRKFHIHDETAKNLKDALITILNSEEVVKKKEIEDVDAILAEQKRKQLEEEELFKKELIEREKAELMRQQLEKLRPEDKVLVDGWNHLEQLKTEYGETKWTIEKLEKKKYHRQLIYDQYDKIAALYTVYWKKKEDKEIEIITGTADDHWARMRDFVKTKNGSIIAKRTKLLKLFDILNKNAEEIAKKKGFNTKKNVSVKRKTKQEVAIEIAIANLEEHLKDEKILEELRKTDPLAANAKQIQLDTKNEKLSIDAIFTNEEDTAKKYAKAEDFIQAEKDADLELFETIRERTLLELKESIESGREERRRFLIKKEFDIKTRFGSRETKWEELYDKKNDVYIYLNTETLERKHIKTAICEMCDNCFAQSDVKCQKCDAARSARNQRLYRPLGYGNITDD